VEIMVNEAGKVQLRDLVKKLIPESIGKEIEKQTQGILPLKDVLVRVNTENGSIQIPS